MLNAGNSLLVITSVISDRVHTGGDTFYHDQRDDHQNPMNLFQFMENLGLACQTLVRMRNLTEELHPRTRHCTTLVYKHLFPVRSTLYVIEKPRLATRMNYSRMWPWSIYCRKAKSP